MSVDDIARMTGTVESRPRSMSPKTSIITVSYDRPDYLAEAIVSVERQTDLDWEHLVYDNHSSDPRVLDVLRAAKSRHPDKFFFVSPGARGPAIPALYWNILIGLSRGRYVTILDDDNRKHPRFLESMTAPMEEDASVDAVSCGWTPVDATGQRAGEDCHWNLLTSMERLRQSNTIDSNALAVRRSVLDFVGQFSTDFVMCEDWHFVIRLARSCRIEHLPGALADYRQHLFARSQNGSRAELYATWNRIRAEMFAPEAVAQ